MQVVRRLDTAVAEDIEHAPAVEGGAGCAGERRSNAEDIAVNPDDFPLLTIRWIPGGVGASVRRGIRRVT